MRIPLLAALLTTALATPVFAQTVPAAGDDAIVTLGGGGRVAPAWDGAKGYLLSPMPIIGLKFLRSPFTGQPTSDTGFGIRPTFRYVSQREFGPASPLFGVAKVDAAFEAGLAVDYTDTWFRAFVEVRQGFGGHTGQFVELGLDGIVHPTRQLTIAAGPRVSFASSEYMRSYFGLSAADSLATGIARYDPKGGYRGAGLGGVATYEIDPHWLVRADAAWTHLGDEAARSPIVKAAGNRDQFTVGLGVAYRFGVGWH